MDISEIQDLIKFIAKAGVTEVEIEKKDFKITIKSEMPKKKGAAAAAEATIQVPVPVSIKEQELHVELGLGADLAVATEVSDGEVVAANLRAVEIDAEGPFLGAGFRRGCEGCGASRASE